MPRKKRLANSLDMPRIALEFTGNGPAPEIIAGPSYGVAPALAASVAAASGGFCTQLPITPEGLLKAHGTHKVARLWRVTPRQNSSR